MSTTENRASATVSVGDRVRITSVQEGVVKKVAGDVGFLLLTDDGKSIAARNGPHLTIEPAPPKLWPPQPGDMWQDERGNVWFTARRYEPAYFINPRGNELDVDEVLKTYGPLVLVFRDGKPVGGESE